MTSYVHGTFSISSKMASNNSLVPSDETLKRREAEAIRSSVKNSKATTVYYTSIISLPILSSSSTGLQQTVSNSHRISGPKAVSTCDSSEQEVPLEQLVPYPDYMNCSLVDKPLFLHLLKGEVSH